MKFNIFLVICIVLVYGLYMTSICFVYAKGVSKTNTNVDLSCNMKPVPVPQIEDTSGRILVWKEELQLGKTTIHSQSVDGDDDSCLRLAQQISELKNEEIFGKCLMKNGEYRFPVFCEPATILRKEAKCDFKND